ncbi:hypothetical protein [Paraburkholderia sp. MM6662-R1]|uniref:hypothetical protein n=1 Tax=Paraburkholderia sp. MM6662-R1 TaxID=2991066 RepID=UPI003D19A570
MTTPIPINRSRAFSAHTTHPNTPESDRQRTVEHDVTVALSDGTSEVVRIQAVDPMEAIDAVNHLIDTPAYAALPRVTDE